MQEITIGTPSGVSIIKEFFKGAEPEQLEKMRARLVEVDSGDVAVTKVVRVKIGRNDSCPCGSGNKFKRCCINKAQ